MTPDGKTFDPETVTDKQLVQYEQAIDRGLTEADAMRLTEHEYNGFQANAIIAAAPSRSPRLPLRAWRSSPPPWKTHVMTPIPVSTR